MDANDAELFNDSLGRCLKTPEFLDRFYELFLASSEEVARKFAHTDFRVQVRMLKGSLYLMMLASSGTSETLSDLERVARLHGRTGMDIRPELYDLWLDCLLQAVQQFDPLFDAEVEKVWRLGLAPGIAFMKSRY